jgi:hypothetical protein
LYPRIEWNTAAGHAGSEQRKVMLRESFLNVSLKPISDIPDSLDIYLPGLLDF